MNLFLQSSGFGNVFTGFRQRWFCDTCPPSGYYVVIVVINVWHRFEVIPIVTSLCALAIDMTAMVFHGVQSVIEAIEWSHT